MNTIRKWTFAASVLAIVLAAACIGTRARQHVLLPTMQTSWESIRVEVEREVAAQHHPTGEVQLAAADAALEAGDPIAVATVDWDLLDRLAAADAVRRKAAGLIGPGVVLSLAERRARFAEAVASFTRDQ